ncbi:MAG: stage III sporulation protein AF [Clostridia bacterium]|jgi:stage III sporulation protein AF|nr:stage III sporulation protein AF [Clostridia bacterium]
MIDFLVSWAEQLILALIVIIIIEIVLPSGNNYKKYIKVVLGIFLLYTIINPIVSDKIKNMDFKEVTANIYEEKNITVQNVINNDKQILKKFKLKFEENLNDYLKKNGYEITKLEQDIEYNDEMIEINKLELKIKKYKENKKSIEKIEIKENTKISEEEINEIKKKICENYELEENKITIESENNYD